MAESSIQKKSQVGGQQKTVKSINSQNQNKKPSINTMTMQSTNQKMGVTSGGQFIGAGSIE
jgi:hypothetical protein